MFFGQHQQKLDAKFRMTIPSQHRRYLEDGMMVTVSVYDDCLLLFPMEEWKIRSAKIEALKGVSSAVRKVRRQFFSHAEHAELDKQGRILLNQRLRDVGQIDADVMVAGNNTHLEIWSTNNWADHDIDKLDEEVLQELDVLDVFY